MTPMRLSSGARIGCAAGCPIASSTTQVARVARALRASGVRAGDRVAAVLPNMPETVVAMLASASLGATWCSCSPDFGVQGVVDRFGQIAPKVLFAVDGYYYNGKTYDCLEKLHGIVAALPTLERVVVVPYTRADPAITGSAALCRMGRLHGEFRARRDRVRAASIRSPALHHVFVGYDRAAEVHRARCGRDAAATPEGARAAHRREARRPHFLLCDVRAG